MQVAEGDLGILAGSLGAHPKAKDKYRLTLGFVVQESSNGYFSESNEFSVKDIGPVLARALVDFTTVGF